MNEVYDDVSLEKLIKEGFGVSLQVDAVIGRRLPVSRSAEATVFLSDKKQLYVYIDSQGKQLLADVKKIVSRMGLVAELYFPPKGNPHYFDEIGTRQFREVFPGRTHITPQDIAFYRTLSPYNPALVLLSGVKDGVIFQFDSDSNGEWRQAVKFSYRRIKTS